MNTGGRFGTFSGLRRLVSFAMARDLGVLVVPGPEIARINDLDIEAAGMKFVASPRHASVLLIIGDIPQSLREAAAVIYAQMMRPRVLLVLGSTAGVTKLTPLPVADVTADDVSQQALLKAVDEVRNIIKHDAFNSYVTDFDAPILQIRIEYTCSMHPEIVQDEPGSCPKCGMDLIQREAQASSLHTHVEHQKVPDDDHSKIEHSMNHETTVQYTCPMHPEVSEGEPGSCPKCGMNLELRADKTKHEDHHDMGHKASAEYTCPMHPDVSESEPGSCPECGMNLELREPTADYTCPMHPAVSESEPGSCPECGMNLELREPTADYTCPMHPAVSESEPGSCPECGMNLELRESTADYTCPMHPEVSESEPGSCPECGMNLELRESTADYTCPMHPTVSESEPGSCPECGMNLELREPTADYTCPMHPDVSESEPGSCPECGMNLELRESRADYTCPMHPEVSESEPGSCPECGMNLELRESTADYTCPMHPDVSESEPGSCPECGMNLELRESTADYTCPMHPEVSESEPGSCPECGMNLELRENSDTGHDHAAMDHNDMDTGFMSMIDMTKDLPRSSDNLPMEWIDVPFGPFFPGLVGGLLLTLTLDGDTVAGSSIGTLVGNEPLLLQSEMDCVSFVERLASLEPLTPICYQVLACQAIENAAGNKVDPQILKARVVAMEQERIVSHLGWLILFAEQTGFEWLLKRATTLQRDFLRAGIKQIVALKSAVIDLIKKLSRTPLLNSRTRNVGQLINKTLLGPVARASGINNDARSTNTVYQEIGFNPILGTTGDVRARLQLRLDEISQSLALIEKMGFACNSVINVYAIKNIDNASGRGVAEVETPRGLARLELVLDKGRVVSATMQTPSTQHVTLIEALTEQQELGDALVTIGSLDLSPWEMRE